MLELVEGDGQTYDLLLAQLKVAEKIRYFHSNPEFVQELISRLQKEELTANQIQKIQLVKIPKMYIPPTALYITNRGIFAMEAKYHPDIQKNDRGKYVLHKNLPDDCFVYATSSATNSHFQKLSNFLPKEV